MRKLRIINKMLHGIVLLTFLLPFTALEFCGPTEYEKAKQARLDSIRISDSIMVSEKIDSIYSDSLTEKQIKFRPLKNKDSIYLVNDVLHDSAPNVYPETMDSSIIVDSFADINIIDSNNTYHNTDGNAESLTPTELITKKFKFLKIVLKLDDDYSGIGYILDCFLGYLDLGGILNAFFLLLFGFIFRFHFKRFVNPEFINLFLGFFGILSLYFSNAFLWGSKITTGLWAILIILDFVIIWHDSASIQTKTKNSN